jgi:hypothetical protein
MKISCNLVRRSRLGEYDYVHVSVGGVSCGTLAVCHPGGSLVATRLEGYDRAEAASQMDALADAIGAIGDALMALEQSEDLMDIGEDLNELHATATAHALAWRAK